MVAAAVELPNYFRVDLNIQINILFILIPLKKGISRDKGVSSSPATFDRFS